MVDKEWLASLKKGDDVAVYDDEYHIGTITKITPTCQIEIGGNGRKYKGGRVRDGYYSKSLHPLTDEIRAEIFDRRFRKKVISTLRNMEYGELSTEKLRKIKAVLEEE